jgi:predicted ATPase
MIIEIHLIVRSPAPTHIPLLMLAGFTHTDIMSASAPTQLRAVGEPADRFVVISGCSGGGKSTLLAALHRRGYATVDEPGRRIVKEELECGGSALPWMDSEAFLRRAFDLAVADYKDAGVRDGWIFFDRGLIDAAAGFERMLGESAPTRLGPSYRYHRRVFLTPPWPEIYQTDRERRHNLSDAVPEYEHLRELLPTLGYQVIILPKIDVTKRADFVLQTLQNGS